jgi:hypothetical protein
MNGSCMRPRADAARKEQSLLPKILHRGPCRRGPFERGKQDTNGLLGLGIGIEPNGIVFCIDQTNRQLELECCPLCLIKNASPQARPQDMQFGF